MSFVDFRNRVTHQTMEVHLDLWRTAAETPLVDRRTYTTLFLDGQESTWKHLFASHNTLLRNSVSYVNSEMGRIVSDSVILDSPPGTLGKGFNPFVESMEVYFGKLDHRLKTMFEGLHQVYTYDGLPIFFEDLPVLKAEHARLTAISQKLIEARSAIDGLEAAVSSRNSLPKAVQDDVAKKVGELFHLVNTHWAAATSSRLYAAPSPNPMRGIVSGSLWTQWYEKCIGVAGKLNFGTAAVAGTFLLVAAGGLAAAGMKSNS